MNMRIGKIFISGVLLLLANAIGFAKDYQELPAILDGSMSLYDFEAVEPSIVPDSLEVVHVSYIARHGARYLTSENKVSSVEKILKKAQDSGTLTRRGKECLELMERVRTATAGQWGMLSPIGIAQERRLGQELADMYPGLFKKEDASLVGISSYVPRVVETMDNFAVPILRANEGLTVHTSSGRSYDYLTRFFVTDKDYADWRHDGAWKEVYNRFVEDSLPAAPARRLVGDNSGMSQKELKKLTYDLYKVLQGLRAMSLGAPTTQWMTSEEYRLCWEATNMEKYFQYTISSLSTLPARGALNVGLELLHQLALVENGVRNESPAGASLYGIFGHAETLLPIFSLLGVEKTVALPLDYDNLAKEWSDAQLTPLAANLEVVYARSAGGALYAMMRLNGKNVSPAADGRLIVPVSELREFWLNRFAAFSH